MAGHWGRLGWLAAGVVLTAIGVVFLVVGLDAADKLGSVISALAAVAGLAVTVAALRRKPGGPAHGQHVRDSTVHGDTVQVQGVAGDVRVGGDPVGTRTRSPRRTPPAAPGGQSVTGTDVGGTSYQIGQVGGDVHIEREP